MNGGVPLGNPPTDCLAAWVAGFRLGHDGLPPALSIKMLEHELDAVDGNPADAKNYDWLWHIMGWTAGQAIAISEMGKP
jgi:hypothetical protein